MHWTILVTNPRPLETQSRLGRRFESKTSSVALVQGKSEVSESCKRARHGHRRRVLAHVHQRLFLISDALQGVPAGDTRAGSGYHPHELSRTFLVPLPNAYVREFPC